MARLIIAMSLNLGVLLLFAIVALSLFNGASILTAVIRGVVALGALAFLGCVAGFGLLVTSGASDSTHS